MEEGSQREELFKLRLSFIKRFLENILQGTQHDESRFFCDYVINCYFECAYFVIIKRIQAGLHPSFKSAPGQAKNLIREIIRSPVQNFMKGEASNLYNFLPYRQVATSLV